MTEFLLLTLYAPLASWGDIAVGESRGSWDRPSRSAVLGLVAAGLGLTRDDQDAHDALDAGYGLAVRADVAGSPLVDYHTTQTVDAVTVKRRRPATRAELLAVSDRQTILSRRTYRQDALATVAIWVRDADRARWTLGELHDVLRRPRFVLFAGRKANALGLPLGPSVERAATLAEALSRRAATLGAIRGLDAGHWRVPVPDALEVSHDPCEGFESGLAALRRDVRRDGTAHRGRWQFAERVVDVGTMPMPMPAGPGA